MKTPRKCGDCTFCCTFMTVTELSKNVGVTCELVCESGCSVHEKKPAECGSYLCWWRDPYNKFELREDDRPDKIGLSFHVERDLRHGGVVICARVDSPRRVQVGRSRKLIEKVSKTYGAVAVTHGINEGWIFRHGVLVEHAFRDELGLATYDDDHHSEAVQRWITSDK